MAWRRIYLALALARLYFALSPSYIHPDEHFQGPEVVAGDVFGWNITKTWEFTSTDPIRSSVPLWLVFSVPMQLLGWIGQMTPNPTVVFYASRLLFFFGSFVFEDWALQELITSPRDKTLVLLLTSSSYVTWTYQNHTFSNSIETLLVLWALVLIQRILSSKDSASGFCGLLGICTVLGIFNRITFPAFLILPGLPLLPFFLSHPTSILGIILPAIVTTLFAVLVDTNYYHPNDKSFHPVLTPLNNLLYNFSPDNLALHGVHPFYTHALINLPQLIGPAVLLLHTAFGRLYSTPFLSAVSGTLFLSLFQHQEARFLIPAVPLLLASIRLPVGRVKRRLWIASWVLFNIGYGVLMGVYHQGGVVPASLFIAHSLPRENVVWWKTYPPPTWLLANNGSINTVDLMGMKYDAMTEVVEGYKGCERRNYLVAPLSATALDPLKERKEGWGLHLVWKFQRHLNLDDLDFEEDGVVETVKRVVGRRGIGVWEIRGECLQLSL